MFDGNIYLIGFMATGKSKVGQLLAQRIGWNFIDTDAEIEKQEGRTIAEVFATNGETYFRKIEKQIVDKVSKLTSQVIALGGGAVVNRDNWKILVKTGVIIRLKATPEVVLARTLGHEDRPLLADMTAVEQLSKIKLLMQNREPFYSKADFHFSSSDANPPEMVVEQIINKLREAHCDRFE